MIFSVSQLFSGKRIVSSARRDIGIKKRYAAELRFKIYGIFSLLFSIGFLFIFLSLILLRGYGAFWQTHVTVPVFFDPSVIDPRNMGEKNPDVLLRADYQKLGQRALLNVLKKDFLDISAYKLRGFLSEGVRLQLRNRVVKDPSLIGKTVSVNLLVSGDVDSAFKGLIDLSVPQARRKVSNQQVIWMNHLAESGILVKKFNRGLFTFSASSRPETSGILAASVGSLYMMVIVLLLAFPIGISAAIYLEEFSKKNFFTHLIEIAINNLAAVPSIVFGLLGLSVFVNFLGMPRSSALVGGMTLALMILPVIIVVTRSSLASVSSSVRLGALALGASKVQMVFHHVVPLAMPGIITGGIIGLARSLGETAPLLIIGMVAFVANTPKTVFDPATALPVQIYMWANQAERAFVERTSGIIIILLVFLMLMNIIALFLRNRLRKM